MQNLTGVSYFLFITFKSWLQCWQKPKPHRLNPNCILRYVGFFARKKAKLGRKREEKTQEILEMERWKLILSNTLSE
jgi:hypothetical protein